MKNKTKLLISVLFLSVLMIGSVSAGITQLPHDFVKPSTGTPIGFPMPITATPVLVPRPLFTPASIPITIFN